MAGWWRNGALALVAALAVCGPRQASASALALNGTGTGMGFTLATVVGGMPAGGYYDYTLVSVALNASGNIVAPLTSGFDSYTYANADNQTLYGYLSNAGTAVPGGMAITAVGGQLYGSAYGGGYYKLNQDGTVQSVLSLPGLVAQYGMWTNPANGHLISSSFQGLVDIDPVAQSFTVVDPLSGTFADGVTVTPDGQVAYVADFPNDKVLGFSLVNGVSALYGPMTYGQQVFATAALGHGSDGMGVLAGTCALAGQIVVNNNDGTVGLIDPLAATETTIASGGNRGDYAGLDTAGGTLFLSQNDSLMRITAPAGCSIGSNPTPEPSGLALLAAGLPMLGMLRRRREVFVS